MAHPPPARTILRVGVSGHRPERLAHAGADGLRAEVRRVLETVRNALGPGEAVLRVVSPLAEGADRIVAEEAMRLAGGSVSVELQAPLPFARELYRADFDAASQKEFDGLLAGRTALELDGSRGSEEQADDAYEAAGRTVLDQSDLLILLWDGLRPRSTGGTGMIAGEAYQRRIPTVWIHVAAPERPAPDHASCLLAWGESKPKCGSDLKGLGELVKGLLGAPASEGKADLRGEYFRERQPRWTAGFLWRWFRDLVGSRRIALPSLRVNDFEEAAAKSWPEEWPQAAAFQPAARHLDGALRRHYAWADGLAEYYANLYRSSFLANYLLGGFAVLFALLPIALGWSHHDHAMHRFEPVFVVSELLIILVMLGNASVGISRRWHERWIDYRLLAEYLRQMRFLAPLGRMTLFSPPVSPAGSADPRSTWMYWHARAVAREVGLVGVRHSPEYLDACRRMLHDFLKGQAGYHERNAHRLHTMERTLVSAGTVLFGGTLIACAAHLFLHSPWLTLAAAVFPAFGAAYAAIRSHGEFELLIKRSEAGARELERLLAELERKNLALNSKNLTAVAEAGAKLMIDDVLNWRIVSEARPLELSG